MIAEDFYESCLGVDVSPLWNLSEKKKNRNFRITSGLGWKPSLTRCVSMEAPAKMLIFGSKMASGYHEDPGFHISVVLV